jgi:hypothetical protein
MMDLSFTVIFMKVLLRFLYTSPLARCFYSKFSSRPDTPTAPQLVTLL